MSLPFPQSTLPTALMPEVASDPSPPRVVHRGRSRAGNAMDRTRTSVIDGARVAFATYGFRRTTMADVCRHAGIAKATLYNHVRTKPDLFRLLASSDLAALLTLAAQEPSPARALAVMAHGISGHPLVVRARADDPVALNAILNPAGPGAAQWDELRAGLRDLLTGQPDGVQEAVLRWLVGHAVWPSAYLPVVAAERLVGR